MRALIILSISLATLTSAIANETPAGKAPQLTGEKLVEAKGCVSCHGKDGNGAITATGTIDPQYPILAGQYQSYLEYSLKSYKDGTRKNEIMAGYVKDLTDADIKGLSEHFSKQKSVLDDLTGVE
jgi:cytochrome c553